MTTPVLVLLLSPVGATKLPEGSGREDDEAVAGGSAGIVGSRGEAITFESFAASAITIDRLALVVPIPATSIPTSKKAVAPVSIAMGVVIAKNTDEAEKSAMKMATLKEDDYDEDASILIRTFNAALQGRPADLYNLNLSFL